ncbi:hypothetical protein RJ641_016017 [Dillenia turbinata]|uniref:Uncharacterized protein n=1 Tax=Dillenia turbinata TaxID=194707 RepID=A0AAN8V2A6_9MAGN
MREHDSYLQNLVGTMIQIHKRPSWARVPSTHLIQGLVCSFCSTRSISIQHMPTAWLEQMATHQQKGPTHTPDFLCLMHIGLPLLFPRVIFQMCNQAADAKITEFAYKVTIKENIGRLQVPMDYAIRKETGMLYVCKAYHISTNLNIVLMFTSFQTKGDPRKHQQNNGRVHRGDELLTSFLNSGSKVTSEASSPSSVLSVKYNSPTISLEEPVERPELLILDIPSQISKLLCASDLLRGVGITLELMTSGEDDAVILPPCRSKSKLNDLALRSVIKRIERLVNIPCAYEVTSADKPNVTGNRLKLCHFPAIVKMEATSETKDKQQPSVQQLQLNHQNPLQLRSKSN